VPTATSLVNEPASTDADSAFAKVSVVEKAYPVELAARDVAMDPEVDSATPMELQARQ
jgi:hypothetical protein